MKVKLIPSTISPSLETWELRERVDSEDYINLTYLSISVSYIVGLVSRIFSMLAACDFTFSYLY